MHFCCFSMGDVECHLWIYSQLIQIYSLAITEPLFLARNVQSVDAQYLNSQNT
jgi:hypothetical protein